jgi:anti-sigma-K factor RskA
MIRDHTQIEELLAVQALGGLDEGDVAALEELLASHVDCEECGRIRRGFDEVAGKLALALAPVPVPSAIADRIVAPSPDAEPAPARPAFPRWMSVAVAATLVIGVASVGLLRLRPTEVTLAAAQTFTSFEGPAGGGTLTLAHTPGRPGAFFWGESLAQPGAGRAYEIWMIRDETPISGGCVTPTPEGRLALFVDASLDEAEVMAVTIEDASCPVAPTTDPVFVAELR